MKVLFHPEAQREFLDAVRFYERRASGLGDDLTTEMLHVTDLLVETPQIGVVVEGEVRRVLLTRFPFDVFYVLNEEHILILALAHHRQQPGFWRERR